MPQLHLRSILVPPVTHEWEESGETRLVWEEQPVARTRLEVAVESSLGSDELLVMRMVLEEPDAMSMVLHIPDVWNRSYSLYLRTRIR